MEIDLNRLVRTGSSLLLASALAAVAVTETFAQEIPLRRPTVIPNPLHETLHGSVVFTNDSPWRLNREVGLEIIRILEELPPTQEPFCVTTMDSRTEKLEDGCLAGTIRPREMRVSTITIEPATSLTPEMARTQLSFRDPLTITLTRLVLGPMTQDPADEFGSEVCHAILTAVPDDPEAEENTWLYLQEAICGSVGVALSARENGLDLPEYQNVTKDRAFPNPVKGRYLEVITLPERLYNSLPTDPVLTPPPTFKPQNLI